MTDFERQLLKEIRDGNKQLKRIADRLDVAGKMLYQYNTESSDDKYQKDINVDCAWK